MSRACQLVCRVILFVFVCANTAFGQTPGAIDESFGGSGRVRTNFNNEVLTDANGWDVVVQAPSNNADANFRKIVLVGMSAEGTRPQFGLTRLNFNGTRDMGFGVKGQVKETEMGSWDQLTDVALDPQNRIIVLGYISQARMVNNVWLEDWRLIRYLPNGDRDTSFSNDGVLEFLIPTTNAARTNEVLVDPATGKIYAAGYYQLTGGNAVMAIYRINSNGTFDTTWGTNGLVSINVDGSSSNQDQAWGIGIQTTSGRAGKVVVAGRSNNLPVVLRLTSAGAIDTTFGANGFRYLNTNTGSSDYFRGMTLDSQDRIVAVGKMAETWCQNIFSRGIVARFTADGAIDTSFSGGTGDTTPGFVTQNAGSQSTLQDVLVDPQGRIVVSGSVDFQTCQGAGIFSANDYQIAAFRYTDSGAPDTEFGGGDGAVNVNATPGFHEQSHGIAIQPDGDILVAADGYAMNLEHMMVARFKGTTGALDTTFNRNGQVLTSAINLPGVFATRLTGGSADSSHGTITLPDGSVIQVGQTWNGWDYDFGVNRLTSAGVFDLTFGLDDPDFDLPGTPRRTGMALYRIRNGVFQRDDPPATAKVTARDSDDVAYAAVRQSNGKIVIVGTSSTAGVVLFRINLDGTLDTSFGTNGYVTRAGSTRPRALIVDSSDKIYMTGEVYSGGFSDLLLARYSANGALEQWSVQNYGGGTTSNFEEGHSLAFQEDGKLVVGGRYSASGTGSYFMFYVGRFDPTNFDVDTTFSLGRTWVNGVIDAVPAYRGMFPIPNESRATPSAGTPNPTGTRLSVADQAEYLVVEADGRITLGGRTVPTAAGARPRYALVRLTASGWIDPTFGTNGWVSTYFDNAAEDNFHDSDIYTLLAQKDGKLVALGRAGHTLNLDFSAARYNWDNGSLDTAFGTNGKQTIAVGAENDMATAGMMTADGKIVIGGYDNRREDFIAVQLDGDDAPTGVQVNAPDLTTDSSRSNYAGLSDNITNDNSPNFSGSPCVAGETVILRVAGQASDVEHLYKARSLCRGTGGVYNASVPAFQKSGGGTVGHLPDGTYKVAAYSATGAGKGPLSAYLQNIVIDTVAAVPTLTTPVTNDKKDTEQTITFTGSGAELNAEVTVWDTTSVAWNATTGAMVADTRVKICSGLANNTGAWSCSVSPLALTLGQHKIKVQQEDIAANQSAMCIAPGQPAGSCTAEVSFFVKANTTTAVVSSVNPSVYGQPFTFTARVRANSGIPTPTGSLIMTYDGVPRSAQTLINGDATFAPAIPVSVGVHTLSAAFAETDKYFASNTAAAFSQTVNKADTSVTVAVSAAPTVYGQPVTFTGTIAPVAPGAGTPAGTVTLSIDGGAPQNLTFTALQSVFSSSALAVGNHSLLFTYSGDANFNGSSKTVNHTVNKASTATALVSSKNPSIFDDSVVYTATVSAVAPGAGSRSGTVTFKDGTTVLGTGTLNASFQATFTTTALPGGSHAISAVYEGDENFVTSTSASINQVVNKKATAVALQSSANPSIATDAVTFTATVNDTRTTGDVRFYDAATTLLGTTAVTNGVATLTISTLTPTTHPITAVYAGDTNFATSTSAALSQVVNKIPTVTTLTSSANEQPYGTSITLTATVDNPLTTGTITFRNGAVTLATLPIANGVATFSTTAFTAATHSLTAAYSGDGKYDLSTSTPLSQIVTRAVTTLALTSSQSPSTFGASVTFTVNVSPSAAPGTVTFQDNGVTLGTATLTGGTAAFTTSALAVSSHPITVIYSGDSNYVGATSAVLTQVVNQAPTATTLQTSTTPSIFGNSVTITATVTNGATGAVTFTDGGVLLGTGNISGNTATFSTTALTAGTHLISAAYSGDQSFLPSVSAGLSQVVNRAPTTVTLLSSAMPSIYGGAVTFTATVTTGASGTVTFLDGTTVLGTGTISSGVATFTTSALTGGTHSITGSYSGDANYDVSTSSTLTQTVDKAASTTSVVSSSNPSTYFDSITFTATVTNGTTGTVTFLDGATALSTETLANGTASYSVATLGAGVHNITAAYNGDGNFQTSTSPLLVQTINVALPTLTLVSSLNPSSFGAPVTFTATLPTGATGTVSFLDSALTVGTGTITNGVATYSTTALAVAAHAITAHFAGDANYSANTSAVLTQTVEKATTTTLLASSLEPSTYGGAVTFTATLTSGATGNVTFKDGAVTLGSVTLTGNTATYTTAALLGGAHTISAVYEGDASYATSTSADLTQNVQRAATTTTLTPSVNPSVYGNAITLTAAVTAGATGTVTFHDGATILGTGTIASDAATFTISTLTGGTHSLSATYAGDGNFSGSTSASVTQTIDKAPTTTTLVSSANPSTYGDAVTYTATVTDSATGTVTFRNGAATLATVALTGSTATFTTAALTAGLHSITASYESDGNFALSTSTAIAQTVDKAPTAITTASSLNPSAYTGAVTFTATVPAAATGSVTFRDGAATLGSGVITNGVATFTTAALTAGTHVITTTFAGDANYNGSTSPALMQIVARAATTTSLASSNNPSIYGAAVSITATVTAGATGSVTFRDGTQALGTVALSGDSATFTTSALTGGSHSITAEYSGDANWIASEAVALTQTVQRAASTTTLGSSSNVSIFGTSVTFTATTPAGATGTVMFRNGATTIGTGTISGQTATFATSALPAAVHALTATYEGDLNFAPSTSSAFTQTVNKAATSTTIASATNPSIYGNTVALTATITSNAAGFTGNVTFRDGATTLGTSAIAGTTATFVASGFAAGPHALTATFEGDGNFATSVSTVLTQTVEKAATITTLSSSLNPSRIQSAVTFTSTVTTGASGSITFTRDGEALGTVPLVSGTASITTATLTSGNRTIAATYSGDANYASSTATPLAQRVYAPPAIAPIAAINRIAGSTPSVSTVATVTDEGLDAGTLQVIATMVPAGLTITGIQNVNGSISAAISASCATNLGANTIVLQVQEPGGTSSSANLTINVTADTAPLLGNYPSTATAHHGAATVVADATPRDNGTIVAMTVTKPASFNGSASIDASSGTVSLQSVNPGTHTFTITATDNCGSQTTRSLIVHGNTSPAGQPLSVKTTEGTAVSVTLSGSDADGDALTFTVLSAPAHGTTTGVLPALVYTPAAGFVGTDSFTYSVRDDFDSSDPVTVTIEVAPRASVVTGITPSRGLPAGGEEITLTGERLEHVTNVSFGRTVARIIAVTPTSVRAIAPAHLAGVVDVTTTFASGMQTTLSEAYTYDPGAQPDEIVLPAVGSTAGGFGSFFKSSMQLFNDSTTPFEGLLVYYAQGQTGGTPAGSMRITLAPGETLYIADVLPALGATGLGSANLQVISGNMPVVLTRVFNDGGVYGTSGMVMDAVSRDEILRQGDVGVLIAPASSEGFRFNVGLRTLASGATLDVTLRDSSGRVKASASHTYDPNHFAQISAADFVGQAWAANDTISFAITSGGAVIYGSTTDNKTQDPSLQQARRLSLVPQRSAVITAVGSVRGNFGSFFKTAMQFYNASSAPIAGRLIYHAQGRAGSADDPSLPLVLQPGHVKSFDDFLPLLGLSGLGSVDVEIESGAMPVTSVRVFNDGGVNGTSGMTILPLPPTDALQAGDSGYLVTPPATEGFRFNVGIRTLAEGVSLLITHRDAKGRIVGTIERTYPASYFQQTSVTDLLGTSIGANDTLTFTVNSGATIVYGSMTDNTTQDPSYQTAKRN